MNDKLKNIAVMLSGNGSNFQAIWDFTQKNQATYKVACVISDNSNAFGLVRAQMAKIPNFVIDPKNFNKIQEHDAKLSQICQDFSVDYIILAGYMRILSADFCDKWQGRIINIHPSLLPKFKGLNTHQRAIEYYQNNKSEQALHGCSVHFVSPKLDSGEIIAQSSLIIAKDDTPETLANRVHELEHQLFPKVINEFSRVRDRHGIILK